MPGMEMPDEQVSELAGVPPRDPQRGRHAGAEIDYDDASSAVVAHLEQMMGRDEQTAVDAHEARVLPGLLERGQRHPDQMAAGTRVQPGVVAVRLDVADL